MQLQRNRCVLVVDDDPGIRRLLAACLRRQDFEVLEACNGQEALASMRTGNADLVIMDLAMPEVSGWHVLRERAADSSLRRIPMIVVTANNVCEVEATLNDVQLCAVLAKPFDVDVLLTTVNQCMERCVMPGPPPVTRDSRSDSLVDGKS